MSPIIDEALEILKDDGFEYGPGYSNHGPMAAEAMLALQRPDHVLEWVRRYRKRLHERPGVFEAINKCKFKEALGDARRSEDWFVFFKEELSNDPWQQVVRHWVPQLAPGTMAGGTHGLIRTAHAVRSLNAAQTPHRLDELARGLAYWACMFQSLPTKFSGPRMQVSPSRAIGSVKTVPPESLGKYQLLREAMSALDVDTFGPVVELVDSNGVASEFISNLTETFATCYLANATNIGLAVTFIHTVTAPSGLRLLCPHLDSRTIPDVLRYGWQAAAALYSVFGRNGYALPCESFEADDDDLIDRAIATGDEHAVKFTEACLREFALNPKPIYRAAACHAIKLFAKEPVTPQMARC